MPRRKLSESEKERRDRETIRRNLTKVLMAVSMLRAKCWDKMELSESRAIKAFEAVILDVKRRYD
jgi:hypothetical protein